MQLTSLSCGTFRGEHRRPGGGGNGGAGGSLWAALPTPPPPPANLAALGEALPSPHSLSSPHSYFFGMPSVRQLSQVTLWIRAPSQLAEGRNIQRIASCTPAQKNFERGTSYLSVSSATRGFSSGLWSKEEYPLFGTTSLQDEQWDAGKIRWTWQ